MKKKICVHCHTRNVNRPRGLCWVCYYAPGVRDQYPITTKFGSYTGRYGKETEEDLDRLIASRRPTMPRARRKGRQ